MIFKCKSCGSNVRYDIVTGRLMCDYCGNSFIPEEFEDGEQTFDAYACRCQSCGAALITTNEAEATAYCSYCGSSSILTERLEHIKKPDYIIPFSVTEEQCREYYLADARKHALVPLWARSTATVESFRPIYMPYWRYTVRACVEGNYYVKKSEETTEDQIITTYSQKEMSADFTFIEESHDASKAFSDDLSTQTGFVEILAGKVNLLENPAVKPFHTGYLSGMYADMADDKAENHEAIICGRTRAVIREYFEKVHEKDVPSVKDDIRIEKKELVYCPVWFMGRKSGDNVNYAVVNGVTGKVVADYPVSGNSFLALAGVCAAVVFLLLNLFLVLRPEPAFAVTTSLAAVAMILTAAEYMLLREQSEKIGIKEEGTPYWILLLISSAIVALSIIVVSKTVSNMLIYLMCLPVWAVLILNIKKAFGIHRQLAAHRPPQMDRGRV